MKSKKPFHLLDQWEWAELTGSKDTDHVELSNQLWYAYFQPDEPLSREHKKLLMERYNSVAGYVNSKVGFKQLITITPSTVWIPSAGDVKAAESKNHVTHTNNPEKKAQPPAPVSPDKVVLNSKPRGTVIQQILELHKSGKTNKEIIELGFNKSTVNRQVSEYKKRIANGESE